MMTPDEIRKYCVIVNQGSGCIFQPLDETCSYILTAKHVVGNTLDRLVRFEMQDNALTEIEIVHDPLQAGLNYFPHPERDIAIIKVPKIGTLDGIIRQDKISYDDQQFDLLGYPDTRRTARDMGDWLRIDRAVRILQTKANGMLEAQIPGNPTFAQIVGQSGGCYVRRNGRYLSLIGIQNRVVEAQNEFQGRVDFTPICHFDEIVALFPEQLSAILPPSLRCFSFIQAEAFALEAGLDDNDIDDTRRYLKRRTQEIIDSNTTPQSIKNHFNQRLLIYNCDSGILQSQDLWLVWLEFLTILKIAKDENFDPHQLDTVFDSVRLLHSDAEGDWSKQMMNIMYSDYKGLKDKGIVLISVAQEPALDTQYIIKPNSIKEYITRAKREREEGKMNIGAGRSTPFDHFTIAHVGYFKKLAILKKIAEYAEIKDETILLQKLRQEFNELLNS